MTLRELHLGRLKRGLARIDELAQRDPLRDDPEFDAWRSEMMDSLDALLPESNYSIQLANTRFRDHATDYACDYVPEHAKYRANGLRRAQLLLQNAIEEIEATTAVGEPETLVNPRTVSDPALLIPLDRPQAVRAANAREIAVVHGRDAEAAAAVFAVLRALDLRPLEWEELFLRADSATPYTGHLVDKLFQDVQAVVVVFTPDDEARLHPDFVEASDGQQESRFACQARPNVLFEAGMAFGLYPHRTILIEIGSLRPISDLYGRHAVRFTPDRLPKALTGLANRLKTAGCEINTAGSDWLDVARFSDLAAFTRRPAARTEFAEQPPRLFPTNIWLNPWETGSRASIDAAADSEHQLHPVVARTLLRDLSRDAERWSLYSRKDGPNAQLRLKGQVNLQAAGQSDLRLILVQQRFAVDGRPIPNPPDAGPFGFAVAPGQEFNVSFEFSVPDRTFGEGDILYGLHVVYEDDAAIRRNLEVFWWYDPVEDKFWNNLNKVPYFDSVRARFW